MQLPFGPCHTSPFIYYSTPGNSSNRFLPSASSWKQDRKGRVYFKPSRVRALLGLKFRGLLAPSGVGCLPAASHSVRPFHRARSSRSTRPGSSTVRQPARAHLAAAGRAAPAPLLQHRGAAAREKAPRSPRPAPAAAPPRPPRCTCRGRPRPAPSAPCRTRARAARRTAASPPPPRTLAPRRSHAPERALGCAFRPRGALRARPPSPPSVGRRAPPETDRTPPPPPRPPRFLRRVTPRAPLSPAPPPAAAPPRVSAAAHGAAHGGRRRPAAPWQRHGHAAGRRVRGLGEVHVGVLYDGVVHVLADRCAGGEIVRRNDPRKLDVCLVQRFFRPILFFVLICHPRGHAGHNTRFFINLFRLSLSLISLSSISCIYLKLELADKYCTLGTVPLTVQYQTSPSPSSVSTNRTKPRDFAVCCTKHSIHTSRKWRHRTETLPSICFATLHLASPHSRIGHVYSYVRSTYECLLNTYRTRSTSWTLSMSGCTYYVVRTVQYLLGKS